jgi:hypothetical protein
VPDALANPQLELHDATTMIARNDNWQTTQLGGIITSDHVADIQNSQPAPTNAAESAIIATLQPGSYTAIVRGVNNTRAMPSWKFTTCRKHSCSLAGDVSSGTRH